MDSRRPRVLIIDDDPFVREVTSMTFTSAGGWDVHVAGSGAEGVELADTVRPDIVLLDFVMPDLDGPATLAELHAQPSMRGVPVVFVTADEPAARAAADLDANGVVGIIAKPFDPMTLPEQTTAWLGASVRRGAAAGSADGEELVDALAQLWNARRPEVLAQLTQLVDAIERGELTDARHMSHTLVGVLGAMGLHDSCALARSIDRTLKSAAAAGVEVREEIGVAAVQLREQLEHEHPSL